MKSKTFILFISIIYFSISGFAQVQKAGDVALDVKNIDVDQLNYFQEGFAVISKGTQSALINSKGEIVVPFGKFKFTRFDSGSDKQKLIEGFVNGLCIVEDPKTYLIGFINLNLALVIKCQYYWASAFDKDGYAIVTDKYFQDFFINKANLRTNISPVFAYEKTFVFNKPVLQSRNGLKDLLRLREEKITGKYLYNNFSDGLNVGFDNLFGYYNRSGKIVIKNSFEAAMPFSEGLAAVAKKNSFGEIKWGFIDRAGNVVIDFNYSLPPGDFHSGYAVVTPIGNNDFEYAFINKHGALFYTVKDPTENENKDFQGDVAFVANKGHLDLLDKTGNVYDFNIVSSAKDKKGKKQIIKAFTFYTNIVNSQIMVTVNLKLGITDIMGNIIVPPNFEKLSFIDPVSNLAKATFRNSTGQVIEGYINSNGVFEIIKSTGSKW